MLPKCAEVMGKHENEEIIYNKKEFCEKSCYRNIKTTLLGLV